MRVSAKAIIIRDGALLALRCARAGRDNAFYILPGGGQEAGESLHDALRRECLEEIGTDVVPGPLLHVRDYLHVSPEEPDKSKQQVEVMFAAELANGAEPRVGHTPDSYQEGVAWLPLDHLAEFELYPRALAKALAEGDGTVYLGAVE